MKNRFLLLLVALLFAFASAAYVKNSFSNFYNVFIKYSGVVWGKVVTKEGPIVDMQSGTSYNYNVFYFVDNSSYSLYEELSPDSLNNINVGDSVKVRYQMGHPRNASISPSSNIFLHLIFAIACIVVEMYVIFKFVVYPVRTLK